MNKRKTILLLVALLFLLTVTGELLLAVVFEEYSGKAHLVVPLFFLALYAVPLGIAAPSADSKHFIRQYLIFKTVKLLLSLGAIVVLGFGFKEQATGVLVNFLIYSLLMLVVENIYVLNLKNKLAKRI